MRVNVSMKDVIAFCREKAPNGIGSWSDDVIARFLTKRHDRAELGILQRKGKIVALAAVTSSVRRIHVWAVIGKRRVYRLVQMLFIRFPAWREYRITALRRGRLVTVTPQYLERLA